MNQGALEALEYDKIINQLIGCAAFPFGKALCQSLPPSSNLGEVRVWQAQITGVVTRIRLGNSVLFSGVRDIGDSLERLGIGSSLSISELFSINSLLTVAVRAKTCGRHDTDEDRRRADESRDDFSSLESLFAGLEPLTPPNNGIKRCTLSKDEVADDVSPRPSHIRRFMKVTADRIRTRLSSILNSNRSCPRDAVITMRDERYCLPVKLEYRNQISGMIHDQSATGSTLFIEPMAVIRLNNEMQELEIQEQKEVEAILASLSDQAAPYTEGLRVDMELLAQLNFISVKASLARHYKCGAPMFNDRSCIRIKGGHHPLLNPQSVVLVSIWLGREFDLLIVTGPDTGGETVSLKTVGLFALMGQSGLYIPAWEGSELVMFDRVFASIGDEQSIGQGLNIFPAHIANIVCILSEADSRSLCLFDELGAGADPTEGAALTIAIPSFLHNMERRIMATTRCNELKVFALNTFGVENACCKLSVEILQPMYRLLIDIPDRSNIFAISQKLGLPGHIINDAKPHLGAKNESSEDLLTSLESSRLTIEKEQAEINAYKDEIASLKTHLTQKKEHLGERKDGILKSAAEGAQHILRETRETADQTIKQINKLAASSGMNEELEAKRARLKDQLEKTDEKLAVKPKGPSQFVPPKKLKIRDGVKALSMNLKDTVSTLPNTRGNLYIQMGILRSLVNIHDLELLNEKDISAILGDGDSTNYGGKTAKGKGSGSSQIKISESFTVSAEAGLIDMTVNKTVPVMKKYLNDAYLAYSQTVHMVHGRGTGTFKNVMYKRPRQLKYVEESRLGQFGESDSGTTVVTFKWKLAARRNYNMTEKQRILIVDDDTSITELIFLYLMEGRYEVAIMGNGEEVLRVFPKFRPNLTLPDLVLPGVDGYQVCRELHVSSQVPIMMLSAKGEISDKVLGLELGVDDRMIRPFGSKGLVVHVKVVLRRYRIAPTPAPSSTEQQGEYVECLNPVVNLTNYSVIYMGYSAEMPPKELKLLYFLMTSPNQVFTRGQLLDHIWGYEYIGDTRTVDVYIKHLCEEIKDHNSWVITTIWGISHEFRVKR